MKKYFRHPNNPTQPEHRDPKPRNMDGKEPYFWTTKSPAYDKRTGCYVRQGEEYGVGYRQVVGGDKDNKINQQFPVPYGRIETMEVK